MLAIDLTGKRAFVAGVADDRGYGWAIVRALAAAGASVCVGTWPPTLRIFTKSLERGKLDLSLPDGGEIELERIYPLSGSGATRAVTLGDVTEGTYSTPVSGSEPTSTCEWMRARGRRPADDSMARGDCADS